MVFSKGLVDEPSGDCVKCEFVFYAAGLADDFGSKEKFIEYRDKDIGLAQSFTKACAVCLQSRNEGRRRRARAGRGKGGSRVFNELNESRTLRKRVLENGTGT